MRAGRLRDVVTLQRRTNTADGAGGYVESWNDLADVWAHVKSISGKEVFVSGQLQNEVTHRVLIRYYSGLKPNDRVVFEGRNFRIHAINPPTNKNSAMELNCIEVIGK
jgi:SPP1 family predicted phage head-tail adaptor